MCTSKVKRSLALFLSLLIIITSLPIAVISSAAGDYPVMMGFSSGSSADFHRYYNKVYSVTFLDEIDNAAIDGALESWDISENAGSKEVMSWMYLNESATAEAGDNRYDVYIAGKGGVGANKNSKYIFYSFSELNYVNFNNAFHTDNATSFYGMFLDCKKIETITGIDWNTSNVTDMSYMFRNCHVLKELDLSSFNTKKVTTMKYMFYYCSTLEYVYIGSDWSIESIQNLNDGVFNCCYAIVGGKDVYDAKHAYSAPGASFAKLEADGGYLTHISEKPQPEKKEYKVTYEFIGSIIPDGLSLSPETIYEEGSTVNVADIPSADGYKFSGWSTDDADITSGTFVINNDVHIVGSWEKLYKVTYKYNDNYIIPDGAPALPSYEFTAGENVTLDDIPFVDGFVFEGWTSIDATINENKFIMPESDVTLYGYFKRPVESIEINGGDLIVNIGEQPVINVTVRPDDATVKDIIYSSDNENVVTIDKNGRISTVGEGKAVISVSSKDDPTKSDTITVTVKNPVTDIEVDKNDIVINKGENETITVTVNPNNATNKEVEFSSTNENIVTVNKDGKITAVGEGTAIITVKSKDNPDITETVVVTVKIPVTEITAADDFTINLGESKNVEAKTNDDATNKGLIYDSSNPGAVKVDSDGNAVAVGEGSAIITITSKDNPDITETVTVTVKIPAEDIIINNSDYELNIGETEKISAVVKPDNTTNKTLTYKSYNENVAIVDSEGKITAVGEGSTTITITSEDNPSVKTEVTVTVKIPVDKVIIVEDSFDLEIGDTDALTTIITPENATNKDVIYKSSDESVVTVDENGNITAIGEGIAKITATLKSDSTKTDEVTISVKKPHINVDNVEADKTEIVLEIGETDKITTTVTPDNATVKDVIFESDNESVAKVDSSGNIIAVGEGTATITVKSKDDNSKYDLITVKVKKPYTPEETTTEAEETTTEAEETTTEAVETTTEAEETTTEAEETTTEAEETTTEAEETTTEAEETTTEAEETTTEAEETTTAPEETTTTPEATTTPEDTTKPEHPTIPEDDNYIIEVPEKIVLVAGIPTQIGIKVHPEGHDIEFTLTSDNENIAFINENGMLVGILPGSTTIYADFGNGDIRPIQVIVTAPVEIPQTFHICFGKTDGIGWYEVSINGGDFFPQGPNSTLEVQKGDVLIVRIQDLWIDDDFEFYVNGFKVPETAPNQITVVVDGFMLIGALSMDISVPDVEESLNLFEKLILAIKAFFDMIAGWFK